MISGISAVLAAGLAWTAFLDPPPITPQRWSQQKGPARGPARAIGGYNAGCLQGARALPISGPGYEVLHVGRRRNFGHPSLVAYVRRLAAAVKKKRLGMLLVGDLSQPRGGPTPFGHRSHQSGLDVDLSYTHPPWLARRRMTAAEREEMQPPAVADLPTRTLTPLWDARIVRILELAASDPLVDRIFVHPAIKREVCGQPRLATAGGWVRKLRPWYGHHDHFHVRLACPKDSAECKAQDTLAADDGCGDSLKWWFTDQPRAASEQRNAERAASGPPPLPAQCTALAE